MSNIQRFEPWPQEWPMEDNDGDLVMYDDHVKIVRGLEVKLAKAVEALKTIKLIDTHEVLDFDTCEPIDTRQGIPAQIAEETLTEIEKEFPTS